MYSKLDLDVLQIKFTNENVDTTEIAEFIGSSVEGNALGVAIVNALNISAPVEVAVQWSSIFIQAWRLNQTFEYTIENYIYPNNYPNLTKDRTTEFDLADDRKSIYHRTYKETIDTQHVVLAKDSQKKYLFGVSFIVLPDDRIFMFD